MFRTSLEMICDECGRSVVVTNDGLSTLAAPDGWLAWPARDDGVIYKTYVPQPAPASLAFCCATCISNWLRREVDWQKVEAVTVTSPAGVIQVTGAPDSTAYASSSAHNASCLIVNNIERN